MPYRDHTKKSDSVKHWTGLFLIESLFSLRRVVEWRLLSGYCWAATVERGGLLAGAAHPRRQKHREMPPPGASAPAFAATVVPLQSTVYAKRLRQDASSTHDGTRAGGWAAFVHRFLISGLDLRIDASFSPFTPSCVHRFLISGPNLRIDANFSLFTPSSVH